VLHKTLLGTAPRKKNDGSELDAIEAVNAELAFFGVIDFVFTLLKTIQACNDPLSSFYCADALVFPSVLIDYAEVTYFGDLRPILSASSDPTAQELLNKVDSVFNLVIDQFNATLHIVQQHSATLTAPTGGHHA
jgi:hypothetical protein